MHIRRHGDGWRVIVQHGGRRRSATAPTRADAQRAGAELLLALGTAPPPTSVTVGELIRLHLDQCDYAATTIADYRSIQKRLPDWLADWPITEMTPHVMDQAYKRLATEGWSPHRIQRLHHALSPAFRRAQRWGWITVNPAAVAERPDIPPARKRVPTPTEVKTILEHAHAEAPDLGCALRVLAATGMRRGEVCALQWDDIDTAAGTINIRRATSSTTVDAHRITDGKTGSRGHRVIVIDPTTLEALQQHRARQAAYLLLHRLGKTPWVFTNDGIDPWRPDSVTKGFGRVRSALGLDHVQLKNLRHFTATQLLGSGVDIRTVAGRLGHASPKATLDFYAGFLPARDGEAATVLGDLLGS